MINGFHVNALYEEANVLHDIEHVIKLFKHFTINRVAQRGDVNIEDKGHTCKRTILHIHIDLLRSARGASRWKLR